MEVGNREKVQIFKDNWIPKPMSFKPVFPSTLHKEAQVAEVIGPENQWNEGLIRQHFSREDAKAMLKIPLPKEDKDDEVLWHFDRKGLYSVKISYQIALQLKFYNSPSCSNNVSSAGMICGP